MKVNLKDLVPSRGMVRWIVGMALMAITVCAAFADPPSPFDFTTAITATQTDLGTVLSTNGAPLIGLMVVMLAFGFVWRHIKRAIHSA